VEHSVEILCCIQLTYWIGDSLRGKVSRCGRFNYGVILFGLLMFRKTVLLHFQDARSIIVKTEVIFSFERPVSVCH